MIYSKFFLPLIITSFLIIIVNDTNAQKGAFKVRADDFISIGYDGYKALTFGPGENGSFGIEYWNGGLNIFKPWPSNNAGNFKLFISDNGNLGVGKIPSSKLDIDGDISIEGSLLMKFSPESQSARTSISGSQTLEAVKMLKVYSFQFKNNSSDNSYRNLSNNVPVSDIKKKTIDAESKGQVYNSVQRHSRTAFSIEEMQAKFPQLVQQDNDGNFAVDYLSLIPILTTALQEQQKTIEKMESKIIELEKNIQNLKK